MWVSAALVPVRLKRMEVGGGDLARGRMGMCRATAYFFHIVKDAILITE